MSDEDRTFKPGKAQNGASAAADDRLPNTVAPHDLGEPDNPQADWGEATDGAALHGANHMRRPLKTEADRNQGARTRKMNKDIVSRRT
jgi:hypothetical protein